MEPLICIIETPEGNLSPQLRSLLAREALLEILKTHHGISRLPEIIYTEDGKPLFRDFPEIHFSLSHCCSAVMAAVSRRAVGCDIEDIISEDADILTEFAFSASEQVAIRESSSPSLRLTELWTAKEARVKKTGKVPDDWREVPGLYPGVMTVSPPGKQFVYSVY